jgi:serine/threonine-protein kinase RsbW
MRFEIVLALPQDTISVPLARRTVAAVLEQTGIDPTCLADVKVALSEACTNVLDHAVSSDAYQVRISLEDEVLVIDVTDIGQGLPAGSSIAVMPDPMSVRGRGAALMAALTDSVNFDTVETGGTAVHMTKQLTWVDSAPLWVRNG